MIVRSKYLLYITSFFLGLTLLFTSSSNVFAQSAADTACSGKRNGDVCTFTTPVQSGRGGTSSGGTQNGFCDRRGGLGGGALYCNTEVNGWEDCFTNSQNGDACKSGNDLGTCKITPGTTQRSTPTAVCDTTQKPTNTPGGATAATCDGKTCSSGQVCTNQGGKPTCTADASVNGQCDGKTCSSGQVCADQGGKPTCTANAVTPGNLATGATPGGSSPQTVGFANPIRFNSIPELIAGIINALLGILGAITVAILVMSGFKYMTSSNPGEVGQALDGIRNAIVGLMIIMGSFLITQYVISALAA